MVALSAAGFRLADLDDMTGREALVLLQILDSHYERAQLPVARNRMARIAGYVTQGGW